MPPLVLAVAEEEVVLTTLGMLVLAVMVLLREAAEVVEVLLRTAQVTPVLAVTVAMEE
jgi:hypothetical protein